MTQWSQCRRWAWQVWLFGPFPTLRSVDVLLVGLYATGQEEASVPGPRFGSGQGTRPSLVSSSNIGEMREQER